MGSVRMNFGCRTGLSWLIGQFEDFHWWPPAEDEEPEPLDETGVLNDGREEPSDNLAEETGAWRRNGRSSTW